ncbi:FKBP65 [Symbiodinium microadriaticum]|nr:FKBP65 [Symbiodinium microadriaticum]
MAMALPLLSASRRWDVELLEANEPEDASEDSGPRLPWGIRKTLLQEGTSEDRPATGDEVRIHFDVRLLDGTAISSSSESGPFEFVVNQRPREIIQGLEIAVQTMTKGEVAEFTIAPRFAYDDLGSPPLVPPDATLVFEIELLELQNKLDVLGDGRAIKTVQQRGSGSTRPRRGQDVVVSLEITSRKGEVLQKTTATDHVVGEKDFGSVSEILSEVLQTMVAGERSKVLLRRFAGDRIVDSAHSGATVDLLLERVYVTSDLLPEQSGLLVKKLLSDGIEDPPRDADLVELRVDGAFEPKVLSFALGSGDVCDALDFAAAAMHVGEEAKIVCRSPLNFSDAQLGLASDSLEVTLQVKLLSVRRQSSASEDRLLLAEQCKSRAAKAFKEGRYRFALEVYRRLKAAFDGEEAAKQFCNLCELNRAACFLKIGRPHEARRACSYVLDQDPENEKARYRRASAEFQLSNYSAALHDLHALLKQQPTNSEARTLADQVRKAQRTYSQEAKAAAARMLGDKSDKTATQEGDGEDDSESACVRLRALARVLLPCLPSSSRALKT